MKQFLGCWRITVGWVCVNLAAGGIWEAVRLGWL